MDESQVFESVVDWLRDRDYRFFVHIAGAHQDTGRYAAVSSDTRSHKIGIGGYKPDVLGFTPADRVFAVEINGENHLRQGLGQAISDQTGVDHAYLAADADAVRRISDLAISKGIGVLSASQHGVEATRPTAIDMRDRPYNTRRQLERRSATATITKVHLPKYANPMNNLMPVLALASHGARTTDDIEAVAEQSSYPYRQAYRRMIQLAQSLGLVSETSDGLELTEQGTLAVTTLSGVGVTTVPELKDAKPSGTPVHESYPALAIFLRNRFAAIPEHEAVFRILLSHQPNGISIQQLCKQLIENHPDAFLSLVYTNYSDSRDAPQLIEEGRGHEIYEDGEYLASIIHSQFISNTVSQFRSLGVLSSETPPIEPKSDLDPRNHYWYPSSFSLQ
jgi:hypothetical protein